LATASDADYELVHGVTFVGLNALVMRRYLHEFGWTHTDFAPFSINAHANGARNPNARLQEPISERDYTRARMVCDPINLLDASPIGDGAAAAVLVPAERVYDRPRARVVQRRRLMQGFFLQSPFLAHCAPLRLRTTNTVLARISRSRNSE